MKIDPQKRQESRFTTAQPMSPNRGHHTESHPERHHSGMRVRSESISRTTCDPVAPALNAWVLVAIQDHAFSAMV